MNWTRITLEEVDSTNTYINKVETTNVVVTAEFQTAGRGHGNNSWECERGKNLAFSLKVSPEWMKPRMQFYLSMAGALAIKDALDELAEGITLKWPNDIYWHDRKISGTLIQTSISGQHLQDMIFGVGINVNQEQFLSDAPNPISLKQVLGHDADREQLLQSFLDKFEHYYEKLREGCYEEIALHYHDNLYRKQGFFEYEDKTGRFTAEIKGVRENGHLVLLDNEGKERDYEFKEVKFIIR